VRQIASNEGKNGCSFVGRPSFIDTCPGYAQPAGLNFMPSFRAKTSYFVGSDAKDGEKLSANHLGTIKNVLFSTIQILIPAEATPLSPHLDDQWSLRKPTLTTPQWQMFFLATLLYIP
jgi:hypothetical protein